jgi:hypothetical protein
MKKYLFPHRFKKIGWVLLILSILAAIANLPFEWEPSFLNSKPINIWGPDYSFMGTGKNYFDELYSIGIILGSILVAFSKEKYEDEYIQKIRLEALVWAVYFNYIIVILLIIFTYGIDFPIFLMYNVTTLLLVFLIRFNWSLFNIRKVENNEE